MAGNEHWTLEQYRQEVGIDTKPAKAPGTSKMRNKITVIDGIRFDSQLEAAYYLYLEHLKALKIVSHFMRQVPFDCGGNVTYRLDFLTVKTDGSLEYVDVKGKRTQAYVNKKKQVEARYPIKITEIFKKQIPEAFKARARDENQLIYKGEK